MKVTGKWVSALASTVLSMSLVATAHAAPVAATILPGQMLTIRFGFTVPPDVTPGGPVDALLLSVGASYTNFFGTSYLRMNLYDGSTLLATRDFSNSGNIGYTLGDCCTFVQPGSPGTNLATIDTNLDTLVSGTIDGRLELTPVWDPAYSDPANVVSLAGDLSPVKFVAYASYWPGNNLEIRSIDVKSTSSPGYAVAWLGSLGGHNTTVYGLSDAGSAAGASDLSDEKAEGATHAFIYAQGLVKDLGTLGGTSSAALAINGSGVAVGWSDRAPRQSIHHAFRYRNGAMRDLGTLGGASSSAAAINSAGDIAGTSDVRGNGGTRAFLYSKGAMRNLGTLGGAQSGANGINDAGWVVGYAALNARRNHAFFYDGSVMRDLGTLGGNSSNALDINNNGDVVGTADVNATTHHAFVSRNLQMTDLGTLGGSNSVASSVNDAGVVVGNANTADGSTHAFGWTNGQMTDLHPFIVAAATDASSVSNSYATSINACGQIAVTADVLVPRKGILRHERRAYLLTPHGASCLSP